jgi:hypothetical protein
MSNLNVLSGNIGYIKIYPSSGGDSVDIRALVTELKLYEDILSPTLTMSLIVVEAGEVGVINSDGGKRPSDVLDGLPIRGGEKVEIQISDNQGNLPNKQDFKGDTSFYINRVQVLEADTQKKVYILDLCSKEYLNNDQSRVIRRYEGRVSDSVEKILKDQSELGLKTKKNYTIDSTLNEYNFIGNSKKPFYTLTWLARKSVPENAGKSGAAAGYFFYETSKGFNFRSIDCLFQQQVKKSYIFSNSPNLSSEKFDKIVLAPTIERNIDLQQNLSAGAYANKSIFFDFYNMRYLKAEYNISNQKDKVENAGGDYEFVAEEFRNKASRLMTHILDVGVVPKGANSKEQLKNWKSTPEDPNFDARNIMVQSIMRYNQLFTIKLNIMIGGNLTLNAGDLIYCDFPDIANSPNKSTNKQSSGIYMIASLCHRLTSSDTYTSLTLVRDSFGKKSK